MKRNKKVQSVALLVWVFFLLGHGTVSYSQSRTGSIVGMVQDPSGAAVPNAVVTARELATGVETKVQSNSEGLYTFPSLRIGDYQLLASTSGFKTFERAGIRVVAGETVTVKVQLTLGEVSETVSVIQTRITKGT